MQNREGWIYDPTSGMARLIKNEREKNQLNKIRNEKGEVTIDNAEIKGL